MKRFPVFQTVCFLLFFGAVLVCAEGQDAASAKPRLGPASLFVVPPDVDYNATHNRANMVEVLATLPDVPEDIRDDVRLNKEIWAKEIRYERDIWCLQFSFKSIRVVTVDIGNTQGSYDKKVVWYWVYYVKNLGPAEIEKVVKERKVQIEGGGERSFEEVQFNLGNPGGSVGTAVEKKVEMPIAKDTTAVSDVAGTSVPQTRDAPLVLRNLPGTFEPRPGKDEPIRFVPQFVLTTDQLTLGTTSGNNPETGKRESTSEKAEVVYVDQVIPAALMPIMRQEGMKAIPETTVSITRKPLKTGEGLWGVAMWTDIDPRINKFSIYVNGLTNDYRWKDSDTATSGKLGEGRSMQRKVLKTNWWRIGDQYTINNDQIQFGQPGAVDYEWVFR